ncbi:type I restriction enzyme endonuclease domain-containing protein [Roseateles sp. GG27B]
MPGLKTLSQRDGKQRFADAALALSKAFSLCCTLDEAKAVREEVAFMQAVKVILTKRAISQIRRLTSSGSWRSGIINQAVVSDSVVDIFAAVGLDKPNIGLLDDESGASEEPAGAQSGGGTAGAAAGGRDQGKVRRTSSSRRSSGPAQSRDQPLPEPLDRDGTGDGRADRHGQEVPRAAGRGELLGLSDDEVRFYDALANNESAVRELSDEILKKIAHERPTTCART